LKKAGSNYIKAENIRLLFLKKIKYSNKPSSRNLEGAKEDSTSNPRQSKKISWY